MTNSTTEDHHAKAFEYKLDMLKIEFDQINQAIARIDQITQTTKNWAVLTWAGSIALALGKGQQGLRPYIILTTLIPILFWVVDAFWRRLQRTFIFRSAKIAEFVNSPNFVESFQAKDLVNFSLLDLRGKQYKNLHDCKVGGQDYTEFSNFKKTFNFKEVKYFYLPLSALSFILGLIFIIVWLAV